MQTTARNLTRREFLTVAAVTAAAAVLPSAWAADTPLRIGTIGSGNLGGTVGALWVKAGHEVMFSSLDLEADKALAAKLGGKARAGTPKEAAAFGEVLLLTVPYSAVPSIGRDLKDLYQGKVIIDASNPIPGRDGDMANAAREKGAGLATAEFMPGARIVRAFNAIGSRSQAEAANRKERYGMPIAGDDPKAIAIASRLIRDVGYEPVLVGGLAMGKYLIPGTPLSGERLPDEIRKIAATLK